MRLVTQYRLIDHEAIVGFSDGAFLEWSPAPESVATARAMISEAFAC